MKICKECGEEKELDKFFVARTNKDGREGTCADCRNDIKRKQYLEDNPEYAQGVKAIINTPEGYKHCSVCKSYKLYLDFYKDKRSSDGCRSACIICTNKQNNNSYARSDKKSKTEDALREKAKLAPEGYKYCRQCDNYKSVDQFYKVEANPDGLRSNCNECHAKDGAKRYEEEYKNDPRFRNRQRGEGLKRNYNITIDEYDQMLDEQDHCCASCGKHISEFNINFAVDHDHSCCPGDKSCGNCIRGLICTKCNTGIGLLGDGIEGVSKALVYLNKGCVIIKEL